LINITGLSLGLTLIVVLMIWLQFEFSFDKFNINADRIFRVITEYNSETDHYTFEGTPAQLGDVLKREIPEVSDYVRFGYLGRVLVSYEDKQSWERVDLADPSIFNIFSFKLLSGDPAKALKDPGTLVLSESKANKYFGNKNPLGQTLILGYEKTPYMVTGVMKDVPANSQLQFDFLGSFSEIKGNLTWVSWNYAMYIMAQNKESYRAITEKLPGVLKNIPDAKNHLLHIQPLTNVHLHSNLRYDLPTNTNIKTIYIISSILLLVLILACINYMNMATARYTRKGKEAGLRKVSGATNSNLVGQFLFESITMVTSAFIIALILSYLLMPLFVSMTGIPLNVITIWSISFFVKCILLIMLISVISGFYPAFMLSSVNPVEALRDDFR
jgi:putative ABC transport system permease protein